MTKENWWDEEAERLNQMVEIAKKNNVVIKVGTDSPPELNKDGTLKRTLKSLMKRLKK